MNLQNAISAKNIEKPIPLYKQVKDMILSIIKGKKLKAGEMLPAEPVLCNMLDVSSITVRRALRELGQDGWICRKPGIGTVVTDKINAPARILVSFHWGIGETAYYAQALADAFRSIEDHEVDIRINSGNADYLSQYHEYHADGMIVIAPEMKQLDALKTMKEENLNFVVLGASSDDWNWNFIDCDYRKAAFLAIEHFVKQGHKNIGLLNGSHDNYDSLNIFDGYIDAMKKYKCQIENAFIKHVSSTPAQRHLDIVREWLMALRKNKIKITALLCGGYIFSTDVYTCANDGMVKIPDEISLVTIDETPVNMAFSPPLTTIKQPLEEMAKEAVMTVKMMKRNSKFHAQKKFIPNFIARRSVKKIT